MEDPRLYILMRTDMDSMNAGKAMAQAAHAANMFQTLCADETRGLGAYNEWFTQTDQGFGTTITLAVPNEKELFAQIERAKQLQLMAGIVHDPTYPVRDGKVTHLIPVNTCGFIFVPEPQIAPRTLLTTLPLHP